MVQMAPIRLWNKTHALDGFAELEPYQPGTPPSIQSIYTR